VWAVDFQFDETSDRRRIKLCNIVDEYTREALAIRVGRACTADDVVEVINGLVSERGAPAYLRSDNGPEFIAWALRDYCRMTLMATSYIEPGSPWENPFVESFNGRLRDELLNIEEFGSITEAKILIEDWRRSTTPTGPTQHSAGSHPPNTQPSRQRTTKTNQNTHSPWTPHRGPVTVGDCTYLWRSPRGHLNCYSRRCR
jgi:putative transposase